jgi:hypothetical protein
MWTLFDLPRDADLWLLRTHCSIFECSGTVVGCVTLDRGTPGARSSERWCFCREHEAEVMRAVCMPRACQRSPASK